MRPTVQKKQKRFTGKHLAIIGLLFLVSMAAFDSKSVTAVTSVTQKVESIAPNIQLLPGLEVKLPNQMERLVVWPGADEIKKREAKTDISKQLPPVFPSGAGPKNAKPIKQGGVSPETAKKQAVRWIYEVFKPEWIPKDIEKLTIALRDEKPEFSKIICRYKINGKLVQISQTRSAMSIIIDTLEERPVEEPQQFAAAVFMKFIKQGEKMGRLKGQLPSSGVTGRVSKVFLLDPAESRNPEVFENWWGWIAWARKDSTLAVFIPKRIAGEAHTTTPDEPWF